MQLDSEKINRIKTHMKLMISRDDINKLFLSWFGGEPLLSFDIVLEITQWASNLAKNLNKQFSATITTNGTLLTPKRILALKDAGVGHYQITIDGDKDTHDKTKVLGKLSAYATTLANVSEIIKHTPVSLRFNYTKTNLIPQKIIEDLDKFLSKQNREKIRLLLFKVWQEDVDAIDDAKIENLIKRALSIGIVPRVADVGMCYADQFNFDCIFSNGYVGKCDNHNPYSMKGEIDSEGYITWKRETQSFKPVLEQKDNECLRCNYLPICFGPCPSKRERMLNDSGNISCQFNDKHKFATNMVRNKHINKLLEQASFQSY
ncbi:MAG: SPASM domain-containing protein [Firmicutes bacterium]|nr:SPASM domain-containing protein [Bacillota bacterium]MCM1400679.1 SPASM domain-containing protein [Bacteroides sp.]MCM1476373.1 SPASM domain-containing protein [Bacteroides sp.]